MSSRRPRRACCSSPGSPWSCSSAPSLSPCGAWSPSRRRCGRGRRSSTACAAATCPWTSSPSEREYVPVPVDPEASPWPLLQPDVLVDARMLKRENGTTRDAGAARHRDRSRVRRGTRRSRGGGDAAWPGPRPRLVVGSAEPDTARPAAVLGFTEDRVRPRPAHGHVHRPGPDRRRRGRAVRSWGSWRASPCAPASPDCCAGSSRTACG